MYISLKIFAATVEITCVGDTLTLIPLNLSYERQGKT